MEGSTPESLNNARALVLRNLWNSVLLDIQISLAFAIVLPIRIEVLKVAYLATDEIRSFWVLALHMPFTGVFYYIHLAVASQYDVCDGPSTWATANSAWTRTSDAGPSTSASPRPQTPSLPRPISRPPVALRRRAVEGLRPLRPRSNRPRSSLLVTFRSSCLFVYFF